MENNSQSPLGDIKGVIIDDKKNTLRSLRILTIIMMVLQVLAPVFMVWFYDYMLHGFEENQLPKNIGNLGLLLYCCSIPILVIVSLSLIVITYSRNNGRVGRLGFLAIVCLGVVSSCYILMIIGTIGS